MFSLCLTSYNRYKMLVNSFKNVIDDPRITEIIVSDDCSDQFVYDNLEREFKDIPKVKLYRNEKNVGMSMNKKIAIELATNPWCIIFDSDNIIESHYLDKLPSLLDPNTIYMPEAALPNFDYKAFSGIFITRRTVKRYLYKPLFSALLNTCNYVVNRQNYIDVYQYDPKIKASDTIFFNYLWLKSDKFFQVVPDMKYQHVVHAGSGFMEDPQYNLRMANNIQKLIGKL